MARFRITSASCELTVPFNAPLTDMEEHLQSRSSFRITPWRTMISRLIPIFLRFKFVPSPVNSPGLRKAFFEGKSLHLRRQTKKHNDYE